MTFTKKLFITIVLLSIALIVSAMLGLTSGSSGGIAEVFKMVRGEGDPTLSVIIWQIRLPRVILAATVGASLSLGGLVFQALLRNPLAEPYILGVSGGSAVGAIGGMLLGFSLFPGVTLSSFAGSMMTLLLVLGLSTGQMGLRKDSLLLGGVMVNAFYSAVITFLISLSQQTSQIHHILFWLMGDFSMMSTEQWPLLLPVIPCFLVIASHARPMNLLLLGEESAATMGVDIKKVRLILLVTTSLMVSLVVCQSGLVGFVGLTIPHIFRMILGSDHRLLIPASILGGSSYLIICDLLARTISSSGEMPVGIITAMVGAPLFIFLLWRSQR
jgi:iron complex transport system permease protein